MERPLLHSVIVFAPDLEVAKRFYCDMLGFAVSAESDSHIELSGSGFELTLFRCESATSIEGYSTRAGSSLALSVSSLEAEVQRLRSHGVTILHEEFGSGPVGRYVAFSDPFGTVHELVESSQ